LAGANLDPSGRDPRASTRRLRELTAGWLDEMEVRYDVEGIQPATVDEIKNLLMR